MTPLAGRIRDDITQRIGEGSLSRQCGFDTCIHVLAPLVFNPPKKLSWNQMMVCDLIQHEVISEY